MRENLSRTIAAFLTFLFVASCAPLALNAAGTESEDTSDAIARLNYAELRRLSHCTAFAIAPRVAVTATHCLTGTGRGEIHVLFGFSRMEWTSHIKSREFKDLGNDVALVVLNAEAPNLLPIGETPQADEGAISIGYGQPLDQIQNTLDCAVEHVLQRHVRLDCPASKGQSGAPVMDEEGRVFGVMVQTSATSSLVALLPSNLMDLLPQE